MEDVNVYYRRVRAGGKTYGIYATKGDTNGRLGLEVHEENGYRLFIREEQGPDQGVTEGKVKVIPLPDEQAWSTFFPLDFFLLGRKRVVAHVMDRLTQRLRAGGSPVKCFSKGCRKQALFYVEAPNFGGTWYACSEQHMSNVTAKGIPITRESYKRANPYQCGRNASDR